MKHSTTIIFHGNEVEVTGEYTPATLDKYYMRNGDPGEPGSPAEFKITKAECIDPTAKGKHLDVTKFFELLMCDDEFYNEVTAQVGAELDQIEEAYETSFYEDEERWEHEERCYDNSD